ncbi:MAG: hypothetical protein R2845_13555 [Thermomicrobiales bacterium]
MAAWLRASEFVDLRDAGDPVELARFYNDEGADELTFSISRRVRTAATP